MVVVLIAMACVMLKVGGRDNVLSELAYHMVRPRSQWIQTYRTSLWLLHGLSSADAHLPCRRRKYLLTCWLCVLVIVLLLWICQTLWLLYLLSSVVKSLVNVTTSTIEDMFYFAFVCLDLCKNLTIDVSLDEVFPCNFGSYLHLYLGYRNYLNYLGII